MTRAMAKRLEKLEQVAPAPSMGKGHWIIGETREELDAKAAALRASPDWQDGDRIVAWRIVEPPRRAE